MTGQRPAISAIPRLSFLVQCQQNEVPADPFKDLVRQYGQVAVRQRPNSEAGSFHVVEDDHYSLLLRGHLYCNQARSLDPQENLRLLLVELHEKGSLATALSRVAGGMFALFALDHRRGIVEATVDRFGCMP